MRQRSSGGGWAAILYTLRKARASGGLLRMWRALRSRNACKTCALGMGGQLGGMVNEARRFPEVCKKSIQAMAADMQGAIHEHFFNDFSIEAMRGFSPRELEAAGRLAQPMYAGPLDSHYRKIDWAEAIDRIAAKLRKTPPDESSFYFSGRSSNEAAFLMQLFARVYGTNNVSNCSYFCHQASGVGLTSVTGSGAGTVTLDDIEHCDLLFVIGANPASNHPRLMRSIIDMRRRGGKVVVINPLRETGLVKFKVPSDVRSMLWASTIADEYIQPHIGGDIALLTGIAKCILERGKHDEPFVREHCEGWDAFRHHIAESSWDEIVRRSGVSRRAIRRLGDLYSESRHAIFCWAMGVTHHAHGVSNVQMIAALALMRGMVGGVGKGLLPLRGHSNVQGVGSMGVVPKLKPEIAQRLERAFDIALPRSEGLDTLASLERAHEGRMKFISLMGGNLYGSSPDADFVARAFAQTDMVVHFNTTLNTGHAWARGRETLILPVLARDEEAQPTTQESMFSYVRFSDGGPARHEGPRGEVDLVVSLAEAFFGDAGDRAGIDWNAMRDHARIREKIAQVIPGYEPLADGEAKREFHIEGRRFDSPHFATESGRAKFHVVEMPALIGEEEHVPGRRPTAIRLMTMRSEGQFNTVVYEEEDVYRGQERRDVILMNREDIRMMNLRVNQRVTVRSEVGSLSRVLVRAFDIPPGNAAMYYPEANVLVPRRADSASRTPVFKGFAVHIEPDAEQDEPADLKTIAPPQAAGSSRARMKAC